MYFYCDDKCNGDTCQNQLEMETKSMLNRTKKKIEREVTRRAHTSYKMQMNLKDVST